MFYLFICILYRYLCLLNKKIVTHKKLISPFLRWVRWGSSALLMVVVIIASRKMLTDFSTMLGIKFLKHVRRNYKLYK